MPSIKVKKGGIYTEPVGIFAKKAGVYSPVQSVYAKVAGSYATVHSSAPTPDRFVSQTATNGYVIGSNSNDGLSKATPWLTLDYAIATAPSGSTIGINDGEHNAATYFNVSNKSLNLVAQNLKQVTLKAASGQTRIVGGPMTSASVANRFLCLYGVILDGQNNATVGVRAGNSTVALGVLMTVKLYNCEINNVTSRPVYSENHKSIDIDIRNLAITGAFAASPIDVTGWQEGSVLIDGVPIAATTAGNSVSAVVVDRVAGGGAASVIIRRVGGTFLNTNPALAHNGLTIRNVDGAIMEQNDLTIGGGVTGWLYSIYSTSLTLTANDGFIRNNLGHNGNNGGYWARYGTDAGGAGNNRQNNGTITGNFGTANPDAATPIHGLMLGNGIGGYVADNGIDGAALATISKQQVGDVWERNDIRGCKSQYFRSKGSTGTKFRKNTVTLSPGFDGNPIIADANDATGTPTTGLQVDENIFNIPVAPTKIVQVAVGSDAAFDGNTYNITAPLGDGVFEYQGALYDTLDAWKANVEPTALP